MLEEIEKFNGLKAKYDKYQVVVSGVTIALILKNQFTHDSIAALLLGTESTIVYRSSPAQKAEVVNFMKLRTGSKVTAAIGDGANDVNMIQQAHVGFGLMGKEGNQASAFADYAMPRFKDLRRALFWHGRPYGLRLNNFVLWNLYKSVINATTKYCANFENGWSGDQPVDSILISLYNVLMTTWFIAWASVWDQDTSLRMYGNPDVKEKSEAMLRRDYMADLYTYTRFQLRQKKFSRLVVGYDSYAFLTGVVIFYIFYYSEGIMNVEGQTFGLYSYGAFATVVCVAIHHWQMFMNWRNWAPVLAALMCLSVGLSFVTLVLA